MVRKAALLICALSAFILPGVTFGQSGAFPTPPGRLVLGDDGGLFTMLADGSQKTYIVNETEPGCWLRDGAWSPDGMNIMYTSICGGSSPTDWRPDPTRSDLAPRTAAVMLFDVATGTARPLVPNDGVHQDYAGGWNPNGSQIVIYSDRDETQTFNLYVYDIPTGRLTQLTSFDSNASRVSFDPTGRFLLYNRRIVDGNDIHFEIRAFDTNTQTDISVAHGVTPNWSPDGQWIAYTTESPDADIYVMPATCIFNGGGCNADADAHNVTYTPDVLEREPIFSPDQTQIVYLRDTDFDLGTATWDVFRQELRTGLLSNLTNTTDSEERHRSWEPVAVDNRAAIADVLPVVVRVSTAQGAANLRDQPTTNGEIVGVLSSGALLFIQGSAENETWYKITLPADGTSAWIYGNLLTPIAGDLGTVPAIQ